MRTADARSVLKKTISLEKGIQQWGNLAALVSALYTNDYDLIARSLVDVVIEPERSVLIPHFNEMKKAALTAGALGSGISGSGPSMMLTKAEPLGNSKWRITGHKWFITGAEVAEHFILMAKTSDDPRKGLTAFMFHKDQPGWEIIRRISDANRRYFILFSCHPIYWPSFK